MPVCACWRDKLPIVTFSRYEENCAGMVPHRLPATSSQNLRQHTTYPFRNNQPRDLR